MRALSPDNPDPRIQQVYQELRALAAALMRSERPDHTLQATALANEAFLRLERYLGKGSITRHEFVTLSTQTVRNVLVDHARRHAAERRGGGCARIELRENTTASSDSLSHPSILELDDLVNHLARFDPRKAQVVQLRYFGGLTVNQVAEHLGLSARAVALDWSLARAWLRREMGCTGPCST